MEVFGFHLRYNNLLGLLERGSDRSDGYMEDPTLYSRIAAYLGLNLEV